MITHIRVQNFKSWKDSKKVELAPLTGFFGTNSSGKSSLLQMLLLLKQTAERKDAEEVIFFGDEMSYVNLGNFYEVIHEHNDDELFELELGYIFTEPITIRIPQYRSDTNEETFDSINFETAIKKHGSSQDINRICYDIGSNENKKIEYQKNQIYYRDRLIYNGTYKNCYSIEDTTRAFPGSNEFLNLLTSKFEDIFSHIYYLGPVRSHPRRFYHWEGDHPEDIGQLGDKTIDALLSARIDRKTIQHDEEEVLIEEKISDWLREMNLAHTFILDRLVQQDGKDYDVRIQLKEDGPKIAFADMGYGLSQFLPVLVLCYYTPEGSTLILEQPGIHLHPKVQSQLADLMIEVVNERNLQILVESHSEHFLTRLQLRIAEEKITADQTALYFCENENGTSKIKPLELDEFGNITNWPKDFFGNMRGDLTKLARKQIERQKEAEG